MKTRLKVFAMICLLIGIRYMHIDTCNWVNVYKFGIAQFAASRCFMKQIQFKVRNLLPNGVLVKLAPRNASISYATWYISVKRKRNRAYGALWGARVKQTGRFSWKRFIDFPPSAKISDLLWGMFVERRYTPKHFRINNFFNIVRLLRQHGYESFIRTEIKNNHRINNTPYLPKGDS